MYSELLAGEDEDAIDATIDKDRAGSGTEEDAASAEMAHVHGGGRAEEKHATVVEAENADDATVDVSGGAETSPD